MNEILIFSTQKSNRLTFVLDFIFNGFTHKNWHFTDDQQVFTDFFGAKINYSKDKICTDEIHIVPTGLIEDVGYLPTVPAVKWIGDAPVLFPVYQTLDAKVWPFDLFSAIFFMLSRHEEYDNPIKDQYGRFPAKESLAIKHFFLHLPVVDIWLGQLIEKIIATDTNTYFPKKEIHINFTYDIDISYTYKGRDLKRQIGAIGRDVLQWDFYRLMNRFAVLSGFKSDPSDTYDYIIDNSINPIFFFLVAERISQFDRNLSPKTNSFKRLVRKIKNVSPIGVHPSFFSSVQTEKLTTEKALLEKVSGGSITKSRQHYLNFTMPQTYQDLIKIGVTEDYSMGFAEMPGFRAGTCTPFYFFDIKKNESTGLKVFPCCIMETMFRDDLMVPAKDALPFFIKYFNAVKSVNGQFISIWHNDSLKVCIDENDPLNFRWLHDEILQYIRTIVPKKLSVTKVSSGGNGSTKNNLLHSNKRPDF